MRHRWAILLLSLAAALAGCTGGGKPPIEERLASGDPKDRASAAYDLAKEPAPEADVRLIHLLADEDEAVRFFAAKALKDRTGERFDFQSEAALAERAASIRQWIAWAEATYPTTQGRFDELRGQIAGLEGKPGTEDGHPR